jgi:hypothetical protein
MKRLLLLALLLTGCAITRALVPSELAMAPGMTIEAMTRDGTMRIDYVDRYTRRYSWDGREKTFRHRPRQSRWYGSLGMYRPTGDGTMHAVLEEGQQHFRSTAEALVWLRSRHCVWTRDGMAVGWRQSARPGDGFLALHVEVWQIMVNGRKPVLPGAQSARIRINRDSR